MQWSSKILVPFESFCHGEWEKITKFWLSRRYHLQNDEKWQKLFKNWNFGTWQNASELQKFNAIGKLLLWWVRKNHKILVGAPSSPSKRWKTMKIGQNLKFSYPTKCDKAQKYWSHWKAFPMVSKKTSQNFGWRAIFIFKTVKNWSKIEIFGCKKMRRSSTSLVPFKSFCHGEWGKIMKFWLSCHF